MTTAIPPSVQSLLPHDVPMIVIDRLVDAGIDWARTVTRIDEQHVFFDQRSGGLPGWALIELMAQTIAAFAGMQATASRELVRIGFLLGTRKMEITRSTIPSGSEVEIEVRRLFLDPEGLASFDCTARINGVRISQAILNVFQTGEGVSSDAQ